MNTRRKLAVYSCIPFMLTGLLAGCQQKTLPPNAVSPTVSHVPVSEETQPAVESGAARKPAQPSADNGKDTMHISSPHDGADMSNNPTQSGQAKSEQQPAAKSGTKTKVDAENTYKETKPALMGLTLKTPKNEVLEKLGKAKKQFVMDDDADPVTVYEYADFSVGFNKDNVLEFVDVHSADVDPGLHGLRLGQKVDDAIRALGKPDTNTSYVLAYKSQGTVLKLDIDPKKGTIQSIKLFSVN